MSTDAQESLRIPLAGGRRCAAPVCHRARGAYLQPQLQRGSHWLFSVTPCRESPHGAPPVAPCNDTRGRGACREPPPRRRRWGGRSRQTVSLREGRGRRRARPAKGEAGVVGIPRLSRSGRAQVRSPCLPFLGRRAGRGPLRSPPRDEPRIIRLTTLNVQASRADNEYCQARHSSRGVRCVWLSGTAGVCPAGHDLARDRRARRSRPVGVELRWDDGYDCVFPRKAL